MYNAGDFPEDHAKILIPFNTFTSDDPSASSTITDLADADIKVHKDGHIDQIVTDGATVVINFDSITGNHLITIDSSVDAAYATGSEYTVRIEGTTVDGATINAWVGSFSIERAGGIIALLKLIQVATITNAAGADIATDIKAIKAETVLIVEDTGTTLDALIKDVPTVAEFEARSDLVGTAATPAEVATALTTYDAPTKAEMDTAHALLATPAEVNAEVVDVIKTDTKGEPATGAPGATISIEEKISWLYSLFRNKTLTTATLLTLRNNADDADIAKATLSDNATTFTKEEFVSG